MADSKLTINLAGQDRGASSALKQLASQIDSLNGGFKGMVSSIGAITQPIGSMIYVAKEAMGAIQGMVRASTELINIYAVQQRAEMALEHTIKATGNAAGVSASDLFDLASALQSVTVYGDEAIIQMQQLFVATKAIGEEVIPRATEAAMDMATVLGTDLAGSAKMLAKVLADPKANLDALKEANIQLTQSEKEQIITLQEANQLQEAQAVVLGKIESSYGGIAKEIGSLETSKLTQISNVVGDIKEGLGEALVNSLAPALEWILESLNKVSAWIAKHNDAAEVARNAEAYLSDSAGSISKVDTLTDAELEGILKHTEYFSQTRYYMQAYGATQAEADQWYGTTAYGDLGRGYGFDEIALIKAVLDEQERRYSLPDFTPVAVEAGTGAGSTAVVSASKASNPLMSFLDKNRGYSASAQESYYNYLLQDAYGFLQMPGLSSADRTALLEIISSIDNKKAGLRPAETPTLSAYDEFLGTHGGLSQTKQAADIWNEISQAVTLKLTASEEEKVILDEIIDSLRTELDLIEGVTEETVEAVDHFAEFQKNMNLWGNEFINLSSSITDLISTIFENQLAETESLLDETMTKWDEYFSELEVKQEREADSLSLMYANGAISLEEYQQGLANLDKEREESTKKAREEEEALQAERNRLAESAFQAQQANAYAAAVINAAQSITKIWAEHGANPVVAGILTGTSMAATGMELATIGSQSYTPMAAGGIVTAPTRALIGEGGYREAVIPLTPENLERSGLSSREGVININISVGTSFNGDQLADDIFHAIERSQRIGALPKWRTA